MLTLLHAVVFKQVNKATFGLKSNGRNRVYRLLKGFGSWAGPQLGISIKSKAAAQEHFAELR
jgi:hypothetical protein